MQIGRDKNATWPATWPVALNAVPDPETGLALLARRRPDNETPEGERARLFWQLQFEHWRNFQAGDLLAVPRAMGCCSLLNRPPPRWLCEASLELCEQRMSDGDKRAYSDMTKHSLRWEAVELVRGRRPFDARNRKKKVHGDAVWAEAAKLVAGTNAEAGADTVRKSYTLINRAGGERVTLPSYKRAVEERDRRRNKKKRGRLP